MVNEIDRQEHVFVIQEDYYHRMVNDHKQKHRVKHRETKLKFIGLLVIVYSSISLPKHRLFQENMEDIGIILAPHI